MLCVCVCVCVCVSFLFCTNSVLIKITFCMHLSVFSKTLYNNNIHNSCSYVLSNVLHAFCAPHAQGVVPYTLGAGREVGGRTPNCRDSRINHIFRNIFPLNNTPKFRRPGVSCTASALVYTSCTRGVQRNGAIGLVVCFYGGEREKLRESERK